MRRAVAVWLGLALALGCGGRSDLLLVDGASPDGGPGPSALADASAEPSFEAFTAAGTIAIERVLIVTLDGLGSVYLEQPLAEGRIPVLAALEQQGAFTRNARTDYTYTFTLASHITMLTGRPVQQVEGLPPDTHHGYTRNNDPPAGETLHNGGNPALDYIASAFDVAHDHGLRTCLYAGKTKFVLFSQSYDEQNGAPDQVGPDNGRDKIDRYLVINHDSQTLVEAIVDDLAWEACDFGLVHITELDQDGHEIGWGSPHWMALLEQVDAWLGTLWTALQTSGGSPGTSALVVTSDHGGIDFDHFDATVPETYTIPFYVVAPGVPPGTDLYELARSARADPGDGRPSYAEPLQPIRNGDAGNVALELLGLPPVPGSLMRDLPLGR
jgi:hypothetical protein